MALHGNNATGFNWLASVDAPPEHCEAELKALSAELTQWFVAEFVILDGTTGDPLEDVGPHLTAQPPSWEWWREAARVVASRGRPELIEEEGPLGVVAIPLERETDVCWVAVGIVVTRWPFAGERLDRAADLLGQPSSAAEAWIRQQQPVPPHALIRMAEMYSAKYRSDHRRTQLKQEVDSLALHLSTTYEEISLLYRLTQNLKITRRDEDLGRLALEWLAEVAPAESLAIYMLPLAEPGPMNEHVRTEPVWLTTGPCPIECDQFTALIEHLGLARETHPVLVNPSVTGTSEWPLPEVRQLIVLPLSEGQHLFGWLAAFNHRDGREFGTVETSLLSSVGAILGIHSGNIELYRQQRDFLAGVVRALTSAIDAKDPYTCGHSDRVARVSVRIAREMGFDKEQLNTLYLSGLLHDIGKIGIDDQVLRKPDKLTAEEYEHIKTHTVIGHRILRDLKQLDQVLPVVLHHHEQWDGKGYPHALAGEDIPLLARIVAVADSFDAMASDRPYRKGMSVEKLNGIFMAGAGQQWDARVVEAFFRARADIQAISGSEQRHISLDMQHWT
jgi:putative nucleotidyltransferase with HDIG domain